MGTATITIPVEPALARLYERASEQDRRKLQSLFVLFLKELAAGDSVALGELMDSISDRAQARGLTPDILESLLDDDD
jgi:predicted DNA-binding ribbon-helix-helix protein